LLTFPNRYGMAKGAQPPASPQRKCAYFKGDITMKSELSLVQLAQELERQQYAKKDYLVTETAMEARTVTDDGGVQTVVLGIDQVGEYTLTPHAHG
jgi:hypothetical protein